MSQTAPEETLALLTRLSQKPGVQSTLVLARETGAIVQTSGLISNSSSANPNSALPLPIEESADGFPSGQQGGMQRAEEVARMVWAFIQSAGTLIQGLDEEDEVKLLRIRTKKNELVIVPDARYLLVVIHDTPPA